MEFGFLVWKEYCGEGINRVKVRVIMLFFIEVGF